jgi:hypothetical protein
MPPENGVNEGYRGTHSPTHGGDCTFVVNFVMLPPLVATPMKSRGFTMNLRRTVCLVIVFSTVSINGVPMARTANAETGGSGSISNDIITAEVRFDAAPTDSPCVWEPVSGVKPVPVTVNGVQHTETLVFKACNDRIMSYHWIRNDAPQKIVSSARSKVSRAIKMLLVRTAPSTDDVVVNSNMWFWVPQSVWKPVRVTAWVTTPAGPISVTVTAKPHLLSYSPGDGHLESRCVGPGTPWRNQQTQRRVSDCTYEYVRASHAQRGGRYSAKASITWNVSWTSSLGIGSPLPSARTSISLPVRVNELQVLLR